MLRVVSFDMGGTFIDFYCADHVWNAAIPQLYARKNDMSFKEARNHVLREYGRISRNDIRWYLPEYWFRYFNLDEDPMEVFKSHIDK